MPEIYDGIVEVKSVARDPGSRAKIAVMSNDSSIDPVGACVGQMAAARGAQVVDELQGEKIDIIPWSPDAATFIVNALQPAEVMKVVLDEDSTRIEVVVPLTISFRWRSAPPMQMLTPPEAREFYNQARFVSNPEPPQLESAKDISSRAYGAIPANWKRPAERFTLARMLEHIPMSRVCTTKRDELNNYFKTGPLPGHDLDVLRHLHRITNTFVQMLQHRHTADYNGAIKWSRTDVLGKNRSSRSGISKLAHDPR